MALLDTLKSGLKSAGNAVLGAVAPGATAVKNTASSIYSAASGQNKNANQTQAKNAASMAPVNSAPLGEYKGAPASDAIKPIGQTPLTNVAGGQTTKSNSGYVATQMSQIPKGTVGTTATAPKPTTPAAPAAPAVNTQISGSNPFGNSNYTPTFSNPTPAPTPQGIEVPKTSYVNAPAPTAPASSPTDLSDLEKAILGTYQQSDAERQAQDALTRLAQQQADLSGAYRSGTNKIGEQPIVLDLLRGQQQALQKQYEGQVGALADQAKPLEVQLANLVANRELQNKALSTQYGFETEKQKAAREAAAKDEGFTLGEGQMRYDSKGNLIARGGEKAASTPASIQEYQYVQSQGYPGSYLDYVKAKDQASGSASVPTVRDINGVSSQYNPATGTWTPIGGATGSSGRPLSAVQANTLAEGQNLTSSVLSPIYGLLSSKSNLFGPTAGVLGMSPYATETKSAIADLNNAAQLVGSYLEGGKLAEGDIARYRTMLPQITDTPAVAKSKLDSVAKLIQDKQNQYLQSYGQSGFDVSGYTGGSQSSQGAQSLLQYGVRQDLIDQLTAMGKTPQEIAQIAGVPFTNASSSALNSSKIVSVKPSGSYGGQCGEFIHNIVKDYPYGLNGINQKESIINVPRGSLPQIGDVVIQRVAGSTGHVAVVNNVDPNTGKITLTESNWNNDERVSHSRQMSINSPTISGYYRGSIA